ncbi:MAG: GNAT family N-acetyltransferase [Acidimicrobiia bacterium]|nr:GNAT family N-acetyltransferase [Acidimicrobiia bacterium]
MGLIEVPEAPAIPGLVLRGFEGPSDYPGMVGVIEASKVVDRIERTDSVADLERNYANLTNCDPYTDMVFAEIDGDVIAYGRVTWWTEVEGRRRYLAFGFIKPEYRRRGLGTAMLRWNERRIREIAAGHPPDVPKLIEVFASDTEPGAHALYAAERFEPYQYDVDMVRPDLDDIPVAPLPAGLEVRTPALDQMRLVFEADREAFRDHPGSSEDIETFEHWLARPHHDPTLWRVAWDGDEVAGQVRSYIDPAENAEYRRKRGYTEFISVRRPWRRKGVARALLCRSLEALRERGMEEAALGVMTDNPNRALDLYEGVGFGVVKQYTSYEKPVGP